MRDMREDVVDNFCFVENVGGALVEEEGQVVEGIEVGHGISAQVGVH